ncbi:MAG TPA: polysaccharide deacetylase family protein [Hanamia sp.]|nr:polysaccharide deacetylase family protein [Hanamia sp.]
MKNLLLKFLYKTGAAYILRSYKQRNKLITILCLHRVSDEESLTFPSFKIKDFERLLQYIEKHYQVVTFETLVKSDGIKPALILSFDDGFLDFYDNALPLLKKYGMPCNLNVVTKCLDNNFQIWTQRQNNLVQEIFMRKHICTFEIDNKKLSFDNFNPKNIIQKNLELFHFLFSKDEIFVEQFLNEAESKMPFKIPTTPMMSWDNLKDALNNYEIELGSHSLSHITLSNIRNKAKLQEEISDSKSQIEKHTGQKVNIFALPNGNYNDAVINQCRITGYEHVLTVDEKLFTKENGSEFKLPRLLIPYDNYYENLLKVENFQNVIKKIIK